MRLAPTVFRAPDVAFISWGRIPGGPLSEAALAEVVPDLAVEVLSPSNTKAEMSRKRREYFEAGVRLVWEVDPRTRTVSVLRGTRAIDPAGGRPLVGRRHRPAGLRPAARRSLRGFGPSRGLMARSCDARRPHDGRC